MSNYKNSVPDGYEFVKTSDSLSDIIDMFAVPEAHKYLLISPIGVAINPGKDRALLHIEYFFPKGDWIIARTKIPDGHELVASTSDIRTFITYFVKFNRADLILISPNGKHFDSSYIESTPDILLEKGDWLVIKACSYKEETGLGIIEAVSLFRTQLSSNLKVEISCDYMDKYYDSLFELDRKTYSLFIPREKVLGSYNWKVRWRKVN